jgi:hypothetical protein
MLSYLLIGAQNNTILALLLFCCIRGPSEPLNFGAMAPEPNLVYESGNLNNGRENAGRAY